MLQQGLRRLHHHDCTERQREASGLSTLISFLIAYGRVTVVKKCGLSENCGPSEHYWWQDECDRKSDEDSYTCSTCCSHTMCNSASPTLTSLAGLFLSLYVSLNKSSNSCRSLSFLSGFIYVLIKVISQTFRFFPFLRRLIIPASRVILLISLTIVSSFNLSCGMQKMTFLVVQYFCKVTSLKLCNPHQPCRTR